MVRLLRVLLAAAALLALSYHALASWTLMSRMVWRDDAVRRPWRMMPGAPFIRDVAPEAAEIGLRAGDELVALEGRRYEGLTDLEVALAGRAPGEKLRVEWLRDGQAFQGTVTLRALGRPRSVSLAVTGLLVSFFTPAACLIVGFGVVFLRPRDPRAWIVWLMMVSFANLGFYSFAQFPDAPRWVTDLTLIYRMMTSALWGVAMLLFALYFPDRLPFDRRHPWGKWLLILPLVLNAIGLSAMRYREYEDHTAFGGLAQFYERAGLAPFWLTAVSVGVFFSILGYRASTERRPDARRRLRLIQIGMTVSLTPTFLLLVAGLAAGKDPFTSFPVWLVIPSLVLLGIYPLTMFYVIVIERSLGVEFFVRMGLRYAFAQQAVRVVQVVLGAVALYLAANALSDPGARQVDRVATLGFLLLFLVAGQRLTRSLRDWLDRKFFRSAVNTERVLAELGESVRTIRETPSLLRRVADVLRETLHIDHVEMFLSGEGQMRPAYATGAGGVAELRLPLRAQDRVVGEIVLGPKKSEEPYSPADVRLLESVANQAALAIENNQLTAEMAQAAALREKVRREMEIAREVQARLLPQTLPEVPGLELAGFSKPALDIGGDYYDFYLLAGGRLACVIADVSGKGVGSALLMASIQGILRSMTAEAAGALGPKLRRVNELVCDLSASSKYATLFFGVYDPPARRLTYVNCGHCEPFVLRGGDVFFLREGGPVVGLFRGAQYQEGAIDLQPGDLLVGYTDGFSEALNERDEEWGEEALLELVRRNRERTPEEILQAMVAGAEAFAGGAPQSDDRTAIVVRVR
jgi:sigma-B regulation protein RsbU (phosphoserine phosphatase)